MKGYPSYEDPTDLTADDVQRIAELATEHIGPDEWTNRDSPSAFQKVATLAAYLEHRSNPEVTILTDDHDTTLETNERTLWIRLENVHQREFGDFDEKYYLPTEERLEKAAESYHDWY